MATTQFFSKVIEDKKQQDAKKISLRFGRSSFYSDCPNLMYLTIDDNTLIIDEATGRKIYDAMTELGAYLGYDK